MEKNTLEINFTILRFKNNFHHKNTASPSLCLYAKNLNIPESEKHPALLKILNTLKYKDDDDFKVFFKIWPNIDVTIVCPDDEVKKLWIPIKNMWLQTWEINEVH